MPAAPSDPAPQDPNIRPADPGAFAALTGGHPASPPPPPPPPKKPHKRRRWPWVVLALIVLLLLLVLLAPTILSSGPVKSYVVSKINSDYLNGTLSVNDISLGWTSGVTINGVRIDDPAGRRVAEIARVRVPISLLGAARGNYDLGDTVIDEPNLVTFEVYPDGSNNLDKLVKQKPAEQPAAKKPPKKPGEPTKLPDVKGKITINRLRATVTKLAASPAERPLLVQIDPSNVVLNIPDINQPIENDATINYRVNNSPPGTVSLTGKVDAVDKNEVNFDKLIADEVLKIQNADFAAAEPFLNKPGENTTVGGLANGTVRLVANGMRNAVAQGEIDVANFAYGGTALNGDTYKSSKLALPINVILLPQGDNNTLIKIQTLKVETDHVLVDVSGNATQQALQNLANRQKPGSSGSFAVVATTKDLAGLVNQLRNTLGLQKDVQVTGGNVATRVDLSLTPESAVLKQNLDASAAGTNAGRPIALEPIHLDTGLTALPTGSPLPDIRELAINLTSAFATAKGGGNSIATLNLNGDFDLKKAQDQIAQFTDMKGVNLAGTGTFTVTSQGDLTKPQGTSDVVANVTMANVAVHGLADGKSLDQPRLVLDAKATLQRGGGASTAPAAAVATATPAATQPTFIESIPTATVTFQSGDANAPVIDVLATAANVTLTNFAVEKFDVQRLSVPDLARAQQQFSAFIPGSIKAAGGSLAGTVTGSFKNNTLAFDQKLQLRNLALQQQEKDQPPRTFLQNENEDINATGTYAMGAMKTANLTALSITSSNKLFTVNKGGQGPLVVQMREQGIGGSGELNLASDLKRLNDVFQAMSGKPVVTTSAGQLTSGVLDATLKLASQPDAGSTIALDGAINNLSVTTSQQPIQNEKVTIAVRASTPPDYTKGVTVSSAVVDSSFAKTTVSDTQLLLGQGTFDIVQKAKVRIVVPDLAKTYAVMQAFSPPATQPAVATFASAQPVTGGERISSARPHAAAAPTTQPLPPLQIAGDAVVDLDVIRDASNRITHVNVPAIAASKVSLVRGTRKFAFDKPLNLKLAADVGTKKVPTTASTQPVDQVEQIKVTQLSGDLGGLATLAMPEPITATKLTGPSPAANGKVGLSGSIEPLTRLLSVLQGADPMPYRGDYAINQNVATASGQTTLKGDATINKLVVLGGDGKPSFQEDKVVLANDLVADPSTKTATINNVALTMPSSQAAGVTLKGKVQDWEQQRKLDGTTLSLAYDLEKLWPLVKPMLSPDTQQQLKDMKIAGKFERTFNVAGSYPAAPPDGTKAIKYLKANGSLAVQLLDTSGVNVQNLELPITLDNGLATTVYANKPKGERTAKPAQFNGGTLDLNAILVDLNGDVPRLSVGKNQKLVAGASINSLLGDTLGKYVNPVFANSKRAKGLLDVTIESCDKLALGEMLKTPQSGTARIVFSLSDMDIANPVGQLMLAPIINGVQKVVPGLTGTGQQAEVFEGYIKDAVITIANGKTTQDVTLELIDPGVASDVVGSAAKPKPTYMPLTFRGKIDLATLKQELDLRVPPQLVSKFIPDRDWKKGFNDAFPQGVPGVVRGTTTDPKFQYGDVVFQALRSVGEKQLLKKIPGIGGNNAAGDGKGGGKDGLDGLIDQITGQKNATPPATPAQPPDQSQPAAPPKKKKK